MTTSIPVDQQLRSPSLTTKQTNPTETEVGQLEVAVLIDE